MVKDKTVFQKKLLDWFETSQRDMPWRQSENPYYIWISEIMLQQTQVKTVIPYFERFVRRFPSVHDLAASSQQDVLKAWEGLGYYTRARNLHNASKILDQDFRGELPGNVEALKKLPGIGDYTSAAIGSIAFNIPIAAVDGNVMRVLSRLFMIRAPINKPSSKKVFQVLASNLLDHLHPGKFNEAVMELGALLCTPKDFRCDLCPVNEFCMACKNKVVVKYPTSDKRAKIPTHRIAIGVVFNNGQFLITRRSQQGLLGGLWEFPGGKLNPVEKPEIACIREIKEETNLEVAVTGHLTQIKHAYTHFKIIMDIYICKYLSGEVVLSSPVDHRWITFDQIKEYPFPKANHKFFPKLEQLRFPD
ncbi:A/G-specific adenine glycosylase [bacterium]|nr:A/G-specific adenine glycosylase [bacterium]